MKFFVMCCFEDGEREKLEKKGLYCYDIREAEDNPDTFYGTIEKYVLVNNIGCIVTDEPIQFHMDIGHKNGFIDYKEFAQENEEIEDFEDFFDTEYYIELKNNDEPLVFEDRNLADKFFAENKNSIVAYYRIDWFKDDEFSEEYYYEDDCVSLICNNENSQSYYYLKEIKSDEKGDYVDCHYCKEKIYLKNN